MWRPSILLVVLKRLLANIGIVSFNIFGLLLTVALMCSVPLYAEGVNEKLLQEELAMKGDERLPRSNLFFRYLGGAQGSVDLRRYQAIDGYLAWAPEAYFGFPMQVKSRYVGTDLLKLYPPPPEGQKVITLTTQIEYFGFSFMEGVENHIDILVGQFPSSRPDPNGPVEVLVTEEAARTYAFKVGEEFVAVSTWKGETQIPVRVAGIWRAKDTSNSFWFYDPRGFDRTFLISEPTFFQILEPKLPDALYNCVWYFLFDPDNVRVRQVTRVTGGILRMEATVAQNLPGTRLVYNPVNLLAKFYQQASVMKVVMYIFSLPIFLLLLYYIFISSHLVVERQSAEIAVLKSRGVSTWQILGIYLTEGLIVGVFALLVGPLLGMAVAFIIGKTYTFLSFSAPASLTVTLSRATYRYALAGVGLFLAVSLLPAMGAVRHSIVSYRQEVSRSRRRPIWQRFFMDFVLLALALYGYWSMKQTGKIFIFGGEQDPFKNPLMLLLPALFIFAVPLVFVRFFPTILDLITRLAGRFMDVSTFLAMRYVAWMSIYHGRLVLLLLVTLAIGTFSSSMTRTLDDNFVAKARYKLGADLMLDEWAEYDEQYQEYLYPPVEEHLEVPGVKAAIRVLGLAAREQVGGRSTAGIASRFGEKNLLAIDRYSFSEVGWFRSDFSPYPLGELMNALAYRDDAILVSRSFMASYPMKIGDQVRLPIDNRPLNFVIAGTFDYFPSIYPQRDQHLFVVNLNYVLNNLGSYPYSVWLSLEENANSQDVVDALREKGFFILSFEDTRALIQSFRRDSSHVAMIGLLSTGFAISALVTTLGFLLFSIISLKARAVQLGLLRALGLSLKQLISMVAFEQLFVIAMGAGVGTLLGLLASRLFVPFLQVGAELQDLVPPFLIVSVWGEISKLYLVLGITFCLAAAIVIWMILRLRVHEAVKLGGEQI